MAIALRRAGLEDARFVWEVNNHPSVRAQSISTADIPWESHLPWFERKLGDARARFYVVNLEGADVGVVRIDEAADEAVISIAVRPEARGRGVGAEAIAAATRALHDERPELPVVAWVRPSNAASLVAFTRAGYVASGSDVQDGVELARLVSAAKG